MTAKEENTVKHHVNCGTPKNRLTQFVRGMKSIEKKVHSVILYDSTISTEQLIHICVYIQSFFVTLKCCSLRKVFVCYA